MRLDKYLSEMGAGTRSELKKDIRAGLVTVDGVTAKDPGCQVSEGSRVTYRGEPVVYEGSVYYMLNKPAGVISASDDPREETVVDLITEPKRKDLFPVGRLDRDTEGLLVITNDGTLAHRLLAPKHHVDKVYFARVTGTVTEEDTARFREGLTLPDGLHCLPAELVIQSSGIPGGPAGEPVSEVLVTIREGKFHQIKRMFTAVGKEVLYLKRLSMGPLGLDPELPRGAYRRLTDEERDRLLEAAGMSSK